MAGIAGKPVESDGALPEDVLVQFRIAHLNMLQGVIGRMAGYSSSVKNFAVTIAAACLALSFDKSTVLPPWIAAGSTLLLGALDGYYLFKEKGFRAAYERVAAAPLALAGDVKIAPETASVQMTIFSVSILPFYFPLLAVAVVLICNGFPL